MNPYDDVDPDDRYPSARSGSWYLCAKCNKNLVLRIGDYCPTCAVIPPERDLYVVLSPKTLDKAVEQSGMGKQYLQAKMDRAFERNQQYVIFRKGGTWHEVIIHDRFPLRVVMQQLFKRLSNE